MGRLLLEGADKAEAGEMDRVVRNLVFCFVINVLALSNLERRVGW